ncbi:TonB-dependent receptor [Marinimicrobium alkaliphilum]|uniref:TonB-dependent receptor n=1 Tax=Marinimicrobium alkaliphilum TaxID=2202654 RepID=UPI001E38CF85|nr:TonB-dependent receptor [Marinimicrobium alkaliphilum]
MAYRDNLKQNATFKKSLLALSVMALSTPALAQTGDQDMILEEIIVSGTRQNLQNAQDIRRNADTFVDAISAEDIGSLPDRSVLEAMQRMPGVSIERFAAPDDPDHFGTEGSGAVVRGMQQTRSEFNGRDSFSANSGRGLNFQDVPPELMGGVDLYKNQSADMIEGGIGGTVSLRTRKPFDQDGRQVALSGDLSWGDMAEKWGPTISGLFSDRWMTDIGEFGLLFNASYSQLYSESHGIQSDAYVLYNAEDLNAPSSVVARDDGRVWMTNGSNFFTKEDDRTRRGFAAAGQWASPDGTMEATAQFLRSDARLTWKENAVKYQGGYGDDDGSLAGAETRRARPHPNSEFAWRDDGVFEAGYITDCCGWRGASGGAPDNEYFGQKFQADTRVKDTRTITDDLSFNFQWSPSDRWDLEADIQFVDATASDDDLQIANGFYALQNFDTTGSTPRLAIVEPWDGRRGTEGFDEDYEPQAAPWNPDLVGSEWYFQNPENYWWRSAMDHYERSEGELRAYRFDATHHLDDMPFLTSVKAGVRYADRNQVVRQTSYNWGHIGAEWGPGGGAGAMWLNENEELSTEYEWIDWSDFHRGGVVSIPGDGFLFPKESLVREVIEGRQLPQNNPEGDGIWEPYQNRADVIPGTYFQEPEIYDTTERNSAGYVRFDFESEIAGRRATGNFGVRYVELDRIAIGSVIFPDLVPGTPPPEGAPDVRADPEVIREWAEGRVDPYEGNEEEWDNDPQNREDAVLRELAYSREARNWLTEEERAFGNDTAELTRNTGTYTDVLPSFNLRVDLNDDWIARFAVSKAIAWPDMSEVRNRAVLGARQLQVAYITEDGEIIEEEVDPDEPIDEGRNIADVNPVQWTGSGGNPDLAPMESWQFDAALEWYFAPVGSMTFSAFYKDLKNFFIEGSFPQTYNNPNSGVTQPVEMTTTRNGGDGHLQGFEIAYQQFYDMLPAPWDGFGIQANYTYIDSEGIPNFAGSDAPTEAEPGDEVAPPQPGMNPVNIESLTLPLRGQSRHTANFVAMYEKNDWAARLAYNWRSEYLITTRDVISGAPIWNTSQGFLDGSVFYNVTPEIKVGLQGTNLLNTQTETRMVLDENDTRTGRSWFVNDRRIALILQATF